MVNGQIIEYTGAEPAEDDVPVDQDEPALAYSQDGSQPILSWNTTNHVWE